MCIHTGRYVHTYRQAEISQTNIPTYLSTHLQCLSVSFQSRILMNIHKTHRQSCIPINTTKSYTYVCEFLYVDTYTYVWISIRMYISILINKYVCMNSNKLQTNMLQTNMCAWIVTNIPTWTYKHTHIQKYERKTPIWMHTYLHTYLHTYMQTDIHTYIHITYINTYVRI